MITVDMVLGAQFGDCGKGSIVDYLCSSGKYDVCARFNGSDNAGHTAVLNSREKVIFNQVPVGALHGMKCVIGRGCVIDLEKLNTEISRLLDKIGNNWALYIDNRCHIKESKHRLRDAKEEASRSNPIGTTLSGNGPAYSDKFARVSTRICDVDLSKYPYINHEVAICDTSILINRSESILVEGAHGIMLDIDHGTYPFVTSSGCTSGAACHSLGIAPHRVDRVIGVIKPYITRVGAGAFPTEMDKDEADLVREKGEEYGTNTKRARRIAWLDIPALIHSIRVGGISEIALTKMDILHAISQFIPIKVCTGYEKIAKGFIPPKNEDYHNVTPIYTELRKESTNSHLIELLTKELDVPITLISVGAGYIKAQDLKSY